MSTPSPEPTVELSLPLKTAETLHAALEDLIEDGREEESLNLAYRVLTWRILAVRGGVGLTSRLSELARETGNVEEYEAARDRVLSPILDGLESAENRDP
jgi:hypothetical protein